MTKTIEIVPYDPNWPRVFESEAELINKALCDNCIEIHHIGSTAVSGLISKPKIDIIAVVKNGKDSIASLEDAGYNYRGEWNIPFKFGFTKRGVSEINLHVFEEGHPEIELNLIFRDHLRSNPDSLLKYAELKDSLLADESSLSKQDGKFFTGYNLGKDAFIRQILDAEGYNKQRFLRVTHNLEWENYHRIRKEQIFDPINVTYDPNHFSINAEGHFHFILCRGTEIVSVAQIEFLSDKEAALSTFATDIPYKQQGYAKEMLMLLERWVKSQGIEVIKMHSRPSAEGFYRKLGYMDCKFDNPCVAKEYVDLGKIL